MDKISLRAKLKNERNALNKRYVLNRSVLISGRIAKIIKEGWVVASYSPFNNEPNPNLSVKVEYFPKTTDNRSMYICSKKSGFVKGYSGIKEPIAKCRRLLMKEINVVIVPGIAFDKRGYRIGYGRGFYDRFLSKFRGIKIGVALDCCIVERIENEKHDVAVDFIVSEKRNIVCKLRR